MTNREFERRVRGAENRLANAAKPSKLLQAAKAAGFARQIHATQFAKSATVARFARSARSAQEIPLQASPVASLILDTEPASFSGLSAGLDSSIGSRRAAARDVRKSGRTLASELAEIAIMLAAVGIMMLTAVYGVHYSTTREAHTAVPRVYAMQRAGRLPARSSAVPSLAGAQRFKLLPIRHPLDAHKARHSATAVAVVTNSRAAQTAQESDPLDAISAQSAAAVQSASAYLKSQLPNLSVSHLRAKLQSKIDGLFDRVISGDVDQPFGSFNLGDALVAQKPAGFSWSVIGAAGTIAIVLLVCLAPFLVWARDSSYQRQRASFRV